MTRLRKGSAFGGLERGSRVNRVGRACTVKDRCLLKREGMDADCEKLQGFKVRFPGTNPKLYLLNCNTLLLSNDAELLRTGFDTLVEELL